MPDTPSGGSKAGGSLGFLGRKLGPAPVWLWALAAVAAYYAWTKYKGGSSSSQQAAADPATGASYTQELSDAEDQITQLQAQVNQQSQGQTQPVDIDITDTDDGPPVSPGPIPAPKPPAGGGEAEVPNVKGMKGSAAEALLKARGFRTTQTPAATPADDTTTVTAQSPGPSQQRKGSTVHLTLAVSGAERSNKPPATKAKKTGKPRRNAGTRPVAPVRTMKPQPVKHPARRAA